MRRSIALGFVVLLVFAAVGAWNGARADNGEPAALRDMAILDHQNLEANLRWILARERAKSGTTETARVGVFADAGCWAVSARSVVEALEKAGVPCRAMDRTMLTAEGLAGLEALILPGGWAPFENAAAGEAGRAAIRAFAENGGRVLGICAGGYMVSKAVAWLGEEFPYPLGLFDGTAKGPVAGFAAWPGRSPARLAVTKSGSTRGLNAAASQDFLYYGGAEFVGGSDTTVLATYPGGGAAIVSRPVGKGEVILTGPHFERPAPADGGDEAPTPAISGALFKALLRLE